MKNGDKYEPRTIICKYAAIIRKLQEITEGRINFDRLIV